MRRLRLPRMTGNDGKVRLNVDLGDFQYKPMPSRKRDRHGMDTNGLDDRIEALRAVLAKIEMEKRCLEATAAGHRADFERERDRADTALAEASKMAALTMAARETAARLRRRIDRTTPPFVSSRSHAHACRANSSGGCGASFCSAGVPLCRRAMSSPGDSGRTAAVRRSQLSAPASRSRM